MNVGILRKLKHFKPSNWIFVISDNIRDICDMLIQSQQQAIEEDSDQVSSLTDTHLIQTLSDIFGGMVNQLNPLSLLTILPGGICSDLCSRYCACVVTPKHVCMLAVTDILLFGSLVSLSLLVARC